jgi:hypothetical protein
MSVSEINQLLRIINATLPKYTGVTQPITDLFTDGTDGHVYATTGFKFRKDPVTMAILGQIVHSVAHKGCAGMVNIIDRAEMAIAAYKVGKVVTIDNVEYAHPPVIVSVRRHNVCQYLALLRQDSAACEELGIYVGRFLRDYNDAVKCGDFAAAAVSAMEEYVPVRGTPVDVINVALLAFYKKKYGGAWKIPGFGPECIEFCCRMWSDLPESFYDAVKM